MTPADRIFEFFERHGDKAYFGEAVSQKEHALQAAWMAQRHGADPAVIVAALLHDIGHLLGYTLDGLAEDIAAKGVDARHEDRGAAWLDQFFGTEVTQPVRMHVAAKRYLCRDAKYISRLSPASVASLALQGGPMSDGEAGQFETQPFYREAVLVRRWDDAAKVPGLGVPGLEHYRAAVEATVLRERGSAASEIEKTQSE